VVLGLVLFLGLNSAIVKGSPAMGDPHWFLLKSTTDIRQPQPDEKIVYGVHDKTDLPAATEVGIGSGEKVTWDTPALNGGFSGRWGWNIEVRSRGESIIRISIGTAKEKTSFIGPFILSYEFSRDEVHSEEFEVDSEQKSCLIPRPVQYSYTFNSYESFFTAEFEFIYLSIEVVEGDEVYVLVNNENSYFYIE